MRSFICTAGRPSPSSSRCPPWRRRRSSGSSSRGRLLLFNLIGGALWATTFVRLGYFGGAAWHQVAGIAGKAGLILLALILLGLIAVRVARNTKGLERFGDRLAERPPLAWVRRRF